MAPLKGDQVYVFLFLCVGLRGRLCVLSVWMVPGYVSSPVMMMWPNVSLSEHTWAGSRCTAPEVLLLLSPGQNTFSFGRFVDFILQKPSFSLSAPFAYFPMLLYPSSPSACWVTAFLSRHWKQMGIWAKFLVLHRHQPFRLLTAATCADDLCLCFAFPPWIYFSVCVSQTERSSRLPVPAFLPVLDINFFMF